MASKLKTIKFGDIVIDLTRNVRMVESSYDVTSLKADIMSRGLISPLVVVERPDDKYDLLQGFRRAVAIREILADEKTPAPVKAGFETVSALVYTALTKAEEADLINDHSNVKLLNPFEEYMSVKMFALSGLTRDQIAERMGGKAKIGFVQERIYISKLPPCVEAAFRDKQLAKAGKLPEGQNKFENFTLKDVRELYKNQLAVTGPGRTDMETDYFRDAWAKIVGGGRTTDGEKKMRTKAQVESLLAMLKSPQSKAILSWVLGDDSVSPADYEPKAEQS